MDERLADVVVQHGASMWPRSADRGMVGGSDISLPVEDGFNVAAIS